MKFIFLFYSFHLFTPSTCDTCIGDDECGFEYTDNGDTVKFGYCLPKGNFSDDSDICFTETNSTTDHEIFALDFCPSDYTWSAILGLVLYLMSFSPGNVTAFIVLPYFSIFLLFYLFLYYHIQQQTLVWSSKPTRGSLCDWWPAKNSSQLS